jgi:Lambda phage tail tube protein, TTP
MSDEVKGYGTRLGYGGATEGPFTQFAAVTSITPPTLEANDIETTHLTTPDEMRAYIPGIGENSDLEATIQFKKDLATTVYGLFRDNTKAFEIEFADYPHPSGSRLRLPLGSYIKSVGAEIDEEELTTLNITVKVVGKPIFVAGPVDAD